MYRIEKTFNSETRAGLKVIFNSENTGIQINGSEEEISVLNLDLEYSTKSGKEFEVDDFLTLRYDNEANEMRIDFTEPDGMRIFKAKLNLTIPTLSEISAKTENGPIAIAGVEGFQKIESENGPIAVLDIKGDLNLRSENGPVKATQITGDIDIEIENGPIKMLNCDGKCHVKGENGIIKIKESTGELNINNENGQVRILKSKYQNANITNSNGGIYFDFLFLDEGNFVFKNENGKINLVVPNDIQCDLTARNEVGKINIGIDGNYDKKRENGMSIIHLVKDSGRVKIEAANQNGSIIISDEKMKKEGNFNFSGFSGIFENIMGNIPEKDKAKVKIKMEKAKEKINNINFDDIEDKINTTMKKVERAVEREFSSDKNGEILNKVKENLNKAMENLDVNLSETSSEDSKRSGSTEKSKIMILQMLQDGKINSEEAEKLLKAIGE